DPTGGRGDTSEGQGGLADQIGTHEGAPFDRGTRNRRRGDGDA
ncbi:hypothetical protein M2302_005746, partial [Micromonospora sp. A200]|nr:hypothetical protein [Micromonospora sp. A200]